MFTRQVIFKDEKGTIFGGIYVEFDDERYIICGCCGGVFDADEVEIVKTFEDWVNIEEEIRGNW